MEQIKKWPCFQLDESNTKKLDDRAFPFLSYMVIYFEILEVGYLTMFQISQVFKEGAILVGIW